MPDGWKYLNGYLRIRVTGFSPERFMNLCGNKDIFLWDIVRETDGYCMCISLRSFYRLKAIVRKTRTKVVILERRGLPFLLPFVRHRSVFVVGFMFAVMFWYVSGYFVWDIETGGNHQVTDDQMMALLEENRVYPGMWQKDLDIESLEKQIRRTFPVVIWTSVRLDGTKLMISLKENDAGMPETEDVIREEIGKSLVSEFDGTVISIVVRSGVPMVKAGDVVEAGQLLVDGRVPVYEEDGSLRQYILRDADADIVIEHTKLFESKLAADYAEKQYTGREKVQYFFRAGASAEYKIPVERPFLQYDRLMRVGRPVLFDKFRIPLYWGSYTYREYQNIEHLYDENAAKEFLEKELLQFLQSLEQKGVQIIEKDVTIDTEKECFVLRGSFLIQERAGRRTLIDEGETEAE